MTTIARKRALTDREVMALECQAEMEKYNPAHDEYESADDMRGVYIELQSDELGDRLRVYEQKPFDGFAKPYTLAGRTDEAVESIIAKHTASMRQIQAFRDGCVRVEDLPNVWVAFAATVIMPDSNPRRLPQMRGISKLFHSEAECRAFCKDDKAETGRDQYSPLRIDDDVWHRIFPTPHNWIVDPVTLVRVA